MSGIVVVPLMVCLRYYFHAATPITGVAVRGYLAPSSEESLDIRVIGLSQSLVGAFKNDFSVTQHQEACIRNTHIPSFPANRHCAGSIDCILRRQGEGVTHPVGDKHSGDALEVAQGDDQLVDTARRDRVQPR